MLLALLACSEYDLSRDADEQGGDRGADIDPCADDGLAAQPIDSDPACELDEQTGSFFPIIEWHLEDFLDNADSKSIMATPAVGDVSGDGLPDIAVITYDPGILRLISGDGQHLWSAGVSDGLQGQGGVAIADLDGDGDLEVVATTTDMEIVAYDHTGSRIWKSESFADGGWFSDGGALNEYCSTPAVADMDGDGRVEVVAGSAIVDGVTGSTHGVGDQGIGAMEGNVGTTSFPVDIDLDGQMEVITGNAFYSKTGALKNLGGDGDGYVAVADFDGDPEGEVVVVRSGTVTVYHHDFSTLWGPVSYGSSLGGPPTVADFDGDGAPEIGVAGVSVYTVLDTDGSVLWSRGTQDATSGVTGSSVFDFEGDGVAEVVYADETTLWVFSGPTGDVKLDSIDHASNTWLEYPVIADVDGDGQAEIVVGHNPYQGGKEYYGITVFGDADESWTGTRSMWNQHAYHITNIDDDGSVPAVADTNWDSYNNFRSGDLHAGQGAAAPNLVPEILGLCEECDEGRVVVWVRVRNEGAADATGVELVLSGRGAELESTVIAEVEAGMASAAVQFEIRDADAEDLEVEVDPAGSVYECDEGDNTDTWDDDACL